MNKLITSILVCCFAFNLYAEQLPAKQFSHPERIRYDQHCFTIEGRDIFILSAAFHYFRVPQELWRDRFRKIKEAGFNTVETYVPWNWHERTMPRNVKDYSQCDFDDLKAWLKMAHEEFGLYTIVRPGPFICAEWAGGGYPRWVAKFCPAKYDTSFWLRSNHPEHMKWTKHWYDAVCPVFAEEQLTRKKSGEKGIIMVQLENEYIYFGMESEKKKEVLRDMAAYCTNNGIEVPLFTCVTPEVRGSKDAVISQLFDMDNQYVWWNIQEAKSRIEDLKRQQPNAPAFVCELQGGWFSTVGGGLSEDSYLDGRHARGMALMAMAGGSTGLNYYMFFGGTNLAGWGARRMTTSYDYGAALKESGGVGEKFAAVKGVGDFVNRFGTQLARSEAIEFTTSDNIKDLTVGVRRTKEGTLFIFIFNKDKKKAFRDNVQFHIKGMPAFNVYCSVEPLDSKVLVLSQANGQCEWYPKEQTLPERPVNMPMPIRIAQAERCDETFQGNWRPLRKGVSLPEIGVNDCRYSMYRSVVKLSKKEVEEYGTLVCENFRQNRADLLARWERGVIGDINRSLIRLGSIPLSSKPRDLSRQLKDISRKIYRMTTYDRCPSLLQESLLLSTYEYIFASPHDRKFGKLCPDEICGMLLRNGVPQESLCYQNYESILAGRETVLYEFTSDGKATLYLKPMDHVRLEMTSKGYDMVPMGIPPARTLPSPAESMGNMPQLSEKIGKTKKARSGEKPAKGAGKSKKRPQIG